MKQFIVLLTFLFLAPNLWAKITVGVVDVQKVLVSIDEGKDVRGKLEKFYKDKQTLLKADEDKFRDLQKNYDKQRAVLNDKAKKTKEDEMKELYMTIQNKTMEYQKELQEMEKDLKEPLVDKIRGMVELVSKQDAVGMTFEAGASVLLYAEDKKDITESVIETYNKKYPVKK